MNMTPRTTAFLIRSRLNYTIFDLCRYLDDECKGVDCNDIRKQFVSVSTNGMDMPSVLTRFVMSEINRSLDRETEIPDVADLNSAIKDNIDIFFDITEDSDDLVFIECANY